jgi:CubicO group peptidase (beta-lactamase class C family)
MPMKKKHMSRSCTMGVLAAVTAAGCGVPGGIVTQQSRSDVPITPVRYVERLGAFGYSGILLIRGAGDSSVVSAQGFADRETGAEFNSRTIFDTGSVTKQFTAAAILRLEADGSLTVGDSLHRFFPEVPGDKRAITVHQLLTHSSGFPQSSGPDYARLGRDSLLAQLFGQPLAFEPGTRHRYSNPGFSVLAAIVEVVSGQDYEIYLQERLLRPAGLTATGYAIPAEHRHRLAAGYENGRRWGIGADSADATGGDFWHLLGNGGIYSTAEDLARWADALAAGTVLPMESVERMMAPQILAIPSYRSSGTPLYYGYGWYVWPLPAGTVTFHSGGNGITTASIRMFSQPRRVLILASNASRFSADHPTVALDRLMLGEHVAAPPPVTRFGGEALAWEGAFADDRAQNVLRVTQHDGVLALEGWGQEAFTYLEWGGWEGDSVLASLTERSRRIVEASRQGELDSLLTALRPGIDRRRAVEFEERFWVRRESDLGQFRAIRAIGSRPGRADSGATSLVAVDFDRGTVFRDFVWDTAGERVADYGLVAGPSPRHLYRDSAGCAVAFSASRATSRRLCLNGNELLLDRAPETPVVLTRQADR